MKRVLSERQARNCEEAVHPYCRCRCNGALHGVKRGGATNTPREFFEALPTEDPHYVPPEPARLRQLTLPI